MINIFRVLFFQFFLLFYSLSNIFKLFCKSVVNWVLYFIQSKNLRFLCLNSVLKLSSIVCILRIILEIILWLSMIKFLHRSKTSVIRCSSSKSAHMTLLLTRLKLSPRYVEGINNDVIWATLSAPCPIVSSICIIQILRPNIIPFWFEKKLLP